MLKLDTCWDDAVAELKLHMRGALQCLKPKDMTHFTEEHVRLIALGVVGSSENEVRCDIVPECGQCDLMIRDFRRGVFLLIKFHCESVDPDCFDELTLALDQLLTLLPEIPLLGTDSTLAECVRLRQEEVAMACKSLLRLRQYENYLAYALVILCVGRRLESGHVTPIVC